MALYGLYKAPEAIQEALSDPHKFANFSGEVSGGVAVMGVASNLSMNSSALAEASADVSLIAGPSDDVAASAINAPRLANQLVYEEASSAFTSTGERSPQAIRGSTQIIAAQDLNNPAIPQGFAKYSTESFQSPSGPFQVHFYMNPVTGKPYYGLDYKAIFNAQEVQPFTPVSGNAP